MGVLAPPIADAVPGACAAVVDALRPWARPTNLLAFAGAAGPEELARIYGADAHARLLGVKDAVDPDNVFSSARRCADGGPAVRVGRLGGWRLRW